MSLPKQGYFSKKHFNKTISIPFDSRPQTSRSSEGQFKLVLMNQLADARKTTALKIGEGQEEKIKKTLEIEDEATKNYEIRMSNHQNYLNYRKNPFVFQNSKHQRDEINDLQNSENVAINGQRVKKHKKKYDTIIDALNHLQSKLQLKNVREVIPKPEMKLHRIQVKLERESPKKGKKDKPKQYSVFKQINAKLCKEETSKSNQTYLRQQEEVENPFKELENITIIKQPNFFEQKTSKTDFNIFSILFSNQYSPQQVRGPRFLAKYHFCQDSLVKQVESKLYINTGEHISTRQRMEALNHIIPSSKQEAEQGEIDLDINIENVKFQDLLNVAAAKVDPETVKTYLSGLKQEQALDINQLDDSQLTYKPRQTHAKTYNDIENCNRLADLAYLKNQQYAPYEKKQLQLSEEYRKKLQKLLLKEKEVIQSTINDRRTNAKFADQKTQIITQQIHSLIDIHQYEPDREKLIRVNKIHKDRSINIKNQVVLSTLINKRIYENASKSKSKNKSKMLNWR